MKPSDLTIIILADSIDPLLTKAIASASFASQILLVCPPDLEPKLTKLKPNHTTILSHPFEQDFSQLRNHALDHTTTNWAMFLDSDETISPLLKQEITAALDDPDFTAGVFKRQDIFLNHPLNHGETASVKLTRLARVSEGRWERPVHEVWHTNGKSHQFSHPILHTPHQSISDFISKINLYTDIEAKYRTKLNYKFSYLQFFIYPFAKFTHNYVLKLGLLDGLPGFIMAFCMALHSLILRIKLYEQKT